MKISSIETKTETIVIMLIEHKHQTTIKCVLLGRNQRNLNFILNVWLLWYDFSLWISVFGISILENFISISFWSLPLTAIDWLFSLSTIEQQKFNTVISVVCVKLNETVERETNRLNELKEVKWFQSLLLWIWSADCFNDCVTAVKLITIIVRYSTPAVDLSVPVSVTLRLSYLSTRNRNGKRNTKRSNFISLLLQFTAANVEAFCYWLNKIDDSQRAQTDNHKIQTKVANGKYRISIFKISRTVRYAFERRWKNK